ncbi:Polyadenylate-binding protein 2 [Platanthera guangdongensis]|uniref:Polyadenylate-binding protein 2 n=1 Tax=Platanthera guangdongensis TaxID=2320717 RepID=A0ABR2MJY5_9ASPA
MKNILEILVIDLNQVFGKGVLNPLRPFNYGLIGSGSDFTWMERATRMLSASDLEPQTFYRPSNNIDQSLPLYQHFNMLASARWSWHSPTSSPPGASAGPTYPSRLLLAELLGRGQNSWLIGRYYPRENFLGKTKFSNVFVKNLSSYTTEEDLAKIFGEYGRTTSIVVMRDLDGKSKCFGFVNFENPDDAATAVQELNGKKMEDKEWYVGRAQKKTEREQELKTRFEQSITGTADKYQWVNLYLKNLDDSIGDEKLNELFSEKLFSMLRDVLKSKPHIDIVKLHKSGGVVHRDQNVHHNCRSYRIRLASHLKRRNLGDDIKEFVGTMSNTVLDRIEEIDREYSINASASKLVQFDPEIVAVTVNRGLAAFGLAKNRKYLGSRRYLHIALIRKATAFKVFPSSMVSFKVQRLTSSSSDADLRFCVEIASSTVVFASSTPLVDGLSWDCVTIPKTSLM